MCHQHQDLSQKLKEIWHQVIIIPPYKRSKEAYYGFAHLMIENSSKPLRLSEWRLEAECAFGTLDSVHLSCSSFCIFTRTVYIHIHLYLQ